MKLDFKGLKSSNPMIEGSLETRKVERVDIFIETVDPKAQEKLIAIKIANYRQIAKIVGDIMISVRGYGSLDFEFRKRRMEHERTGHSGRVADHALKIAAGEA